MEFVSGVSACGSVVGVLVQRLGARASVRRVVFSTQNKGTSEV